MDLLGDLVIDVVSGGKRLPCASMLLSGALHHDRTMADTSRTMPMSLKRVRRVAIPRIASVGLSRFGASFIPRTLDG
jgi:hypothetical protein